MMNWKGSGRKRSWSNFKVLSQNFPGETEIRIQVSGPRFDPGTCEYEAGVSITRSLS
jgi:hypothetical protein